MSRVTTAYVSAYDRTRVHSSQLYRFEKRTLTANFAGALPSGIFLSTITWYCHNTDVVVMADAAASPTESSVTITANCSGMALLKCEATLTDGQVINQLFSVDSLPVPYLCGETILSNGPCELVCSVIWLTVSGHLPNGTLGDVVDYSYAATGLRAPFTFSLASGTLPTGLSLSASGAVSGTLSEAVQDGSTFAWVIRGTDALGNVEDLADSCTVAGMTLAGHLPAGVIGDSGAYQYTSANGIGDVVYSVESGAVPDGATLDTSGLVVYSYAASGVYAWVVKASDTLGNFATLSDSTTVAMMQWWATGSSGAGLYVSNDLSSWSAVEMQPYVQSALFGPVSLGVGHAAIFTGGTDIGVISDFDHPITPAVVSGGNNPVAVESFDDGAIVVQMKINGDTKIRVSTDHGLTWNEYAPPGGWKVGGITRLNSGRWLFSEYAHSGTTRFWYTDNALPDGAWTSVPVPGPSSPYGQFVSNGTVAVVFNNVGSGYRTSDGVTWESVTYTGEATVDQRAKVAIGDVFLKCVGQNGSINRSIDAGQTWTNATLPSAGTPLRMVYGNGVVVVSNNSGKLDVSYDQGLTWAALAPPVVGTSFVVGFVVWVP